MTPPKVPETPYPRSSVMISKIFGAPLGGTMLAGHHGLEFLGVEADLATERRRRIWKGVCS